MLVSQIEEAIADFNEYSSFDLMKNLNIDINQIADIAEGNRISVAGSFRYRKSVLASLAKLSNAVYGTKIDTDATMMVIAQGLAASELWNYLLGTR